ncbi:MAG TPA: MAPEG family protein [Nannocystis sp.]|jgi:uncharacterized MAPEG superfamily protein
MHIPLLCLLGFVSWTVLIVVVGIAGVRFTAIATGTAPPNGFPADVPHGSDRYRRTMRAHINSVENLPLFASVVLTGAVVHAGSPLMDTLALTYLGARVFHTLFHVASGRGLGIALRLTAYVVQLVCLSWMGVLVARVILASKLV